MPRRVAEAESSGRWGTVHLITDLHLLVVRPRHCAYGDAVELHRTDERCAALTPNSKGAALNVPSSARLGWSGRPLNSARLRPARFAPKSSARCSDDDAAGWCAREQDHVLRPTEHAPGPFREQLFTAVDVRAKSYSISSTRTIGSRTPVPLLARTSARGEDVRHLSRRVRSPRPAAEDLEAAGSVIIGASARKPVKAPCDFTTSSPRTDGVAKITYRARLITEPGWLALDTRLVPTSEAGASRPCRGGHRHARTCRRLETGDTASGDHRAIAALAAASRWPEQAEDGGQAGWTSADGRRG